MRIDDDVKDEIPPPVIRNRRWVPRLVWIVPVVAAVIGISLLVRNWQNAGPTITIRFQSGEGVQVGKTLVKYRDVVIGRVTAVALSDDQANVLVTADMTKSAGALLHNDTKFWVVRPRVGVGWISGFDTLLSGAYIGASTGSSMVAERRFTGLENPPAIPHGPNGKAVTLHAAKVGSLAPGAPVYFRQFKVGRVTDENLLPDGNTQVSAFIEAPYDRFVKPYSRFWNASGVSLSLGADGLNVKTESIATVIAGGIAFDDGPSDGVPSRVNVADAFLLYKTEADAMAPPDGEPRYLRMKFAQALRGLEVGAAVEFVGVDIGTVVSVDLGYEPSDRSFPVIVTAKLYPRRMGQAYKSLTEQGKTESEATLAEFVGAMVGRGLRAQPRSASLLTSKLYIALDFLPNSHPVVFDSSKRPLELPTVNGTYQELESSVARIVKRVGDVPFEKMAAHLDMDLMDLHGTLSALNSQLLPRAVDDLSALHLTLDTANQTLDESSPLRKSLSDTLEETRNTLSAVRELASYIDRHPEALVRGRRAQKPVKALHPEVVP